MEGRGHGVGGDQAGAIGGGGDLIAGHHVAHGENHQRIEADAQNDGEDEDLADLLKRHVDLFGGLWNHVKADEEERADGGDLDDGGHHAAHARAFEHLVLQVGGISGDHGCRDQQDAGGADAQGQNVLQLGRDLRTHDIDDGDEDGEQHGGAQPCGVDIESCDGV